MEWKVSISEIEIKNLIEIKELTKTWSKRVEIEFTKIIKIDNKLDKLLEELKG